MAAAIDGSNTGQAPWYRQNLPRKRKNLRIELRLSAYSKLERLRGSDGAGRPEPIVAVIERLIEQTPELSAGKRNHVHDVPRIRGSVA